MDATTRPIQGKAGRVILKAIICLFKGHDIDPDESIVGDIMIDKRNWLCMTELRYKAL